MHRSRLGQTAFVLDSEFRLLNVKAKESEETLVDSSRRGEMRRGTSLPLQLTGSFRSQRVDSQVPSRYWGLRLLLPIYTPRSSRSLAPVHHPHINSESKRVYCVLETRSGQWRFLLEMLYSHSRLWTSFCNSKVPSFFPSPGLEHKQRG